MKCNYVNYLEDHPNLEEALLGGAKIHIFRSGGGLRVVRVNGKDGKLISYGEHPYLSVALSHAENDFGLSYDEQYSNGQAKHEHYLSGAYPMPFDPIDIYVHGGNTLDIFYSKKWENIICTTPTQNELNRENEILWGASKTLMGAISLCLVCFKFEDKESFMKRV